MKKILGLDLGTNSIGWAVINSEINEEKLIGIDAAGSRIIPMDAAILGNFDAGNSISQTAERTGYRGVRRLRERCLLRRERLHRILDLLGFLPPHYAQQLDRYGKFSANTEPKLAWRKNEQGDYEFIFQDSFNEMLADFQQNKPQLVAGDKKIPYDWTLYYLRKKAISHKVSKEELAWLLLNFNQKRGYYQLRGEDEEETKQDNISIISSRILEVTKQEKDKKYEKFWYEVQLENDLIYRAAFYNDISFWKGTEREFVLKTTTLKDGTIKQEISFLPSFEEIEKMDKKAKDKMYAKIKLKTEKTIDDSGKTVGTYIYDSILQNPSQKVRGKLVRTIERKYYKDELRQILEKQKEFHNELKDKKLYSDCLNELYSNNEAHRNNIANRDFTYLFLDDIIFYQRYLKRKKSLIDDCPYESRFDEDGKKYPIKCIAKSNPLYQEFRLWQFVSNLRIFQREKEVNGKLETDVDVTNEFLKSEDDYTDLFDWLNDRKEVDQKVFLKYPKFGLKKDADKYRWNYVEDKVYPCNKTRYSILAKLSKNEKNRLSFELEYKIWHLLYSVTTQSEIDSVFKEKNQEKGIYKTLTQMFLNDTILKLKSIKIEEKGYGAYSEKAIKKLLPLMRMGKYWDENAIDEHTKQRIDKIITGEYDENIRNRVREKAINLTDISHFRGLPIWLACYIVYDRHSETKDIEKWEKPADIDEYLKTFKQHSLRNPIVEQVITETLRTVRDIWKQVGRIDEIHVELGREMKNPADKRAKMTQQISQNENTNLRIKAMLVEFLNPELKIENVRPYSPSQQDILRIYEEYAVSNIKDDDKEFDFVSKISKKAQPSKTEIQRYKLWLEQKYCSPYTGKPIPLSKLFTPAYEIEHVIPQSRYFDDSFSNKVICEAEVNKLKDRDLGYEFIKNHHGEKVALNFGETVEIFTVEAYEKFVKDNYSRNCGKMKKLLMDEIPDKFIERQLNDSRYISKFIKSLLSNIVREKDEKGEYEQEAISKNLITCTGGITDRLKKDWGMNDVWNLIVLPRFERLNELTGQLDRKYFENRFLELFIHYANPLLSDNDKLSANATLYDLKEAYKLLDINSQNKLIKNIKDELGDKKSFLSVNNEGHIIPNMPLELQKGFNKKRIDHRHHAMDAIVIACATRKHVQYLNNENAKVQNRQLQLGLAKDLCEFEEKEFTKPIKNNKGVWVEGTEKVKKTVPIRIKKPWNTFTQDSRTALENIIVSFKQNLRVVNKTVNHYQHYENGKKVLIKQVKGDSWAIRKPMHKETVFGRVNLRKIKEVRLSEVLKKPQLIVNKELKDKIKELISKGYDKKKIKKYFDENKDVWTDVNLSKISIYYFSNDTNERYFATRKLVDTSFDKKKIESSVTDTGVQKILFKHLIKYDRICFDNSKYEILINGRIYQELHKEIELQQTYIEHIIMDRGSKFYYDGKEIDANEIDEINTAKEKCKMVLETNPKKIAIINHAELAFSPDGIEEMNRNIKDLNDGKNHQPIIKVRVYEKADKFPVGEKGNKITKFVEAAKGTNLFFAVYQTKTIDKETGEEKTVRSHATVPLNIAIKCQKTAGNNWKNEIDSELKKKKYVPEDTELLFILSPNDLVYLPTENDLKNGSIAQPLDKNRIYKMVDSSDTTANFVSCSVSSLIYSLPKPLAETFCNNTIVQNEFGVGSPQSKNQRAITGEMIKEICVPLKVDSLGNIVELNGKKYD